MSRSLLLIGFCCAALAAPALQAEETLEQQLKNQLTNMECPGALVGIFPANGKPTRFALGVADVKTKQPMQLNFHMRIASITKLFVGTIVLQLAEEGKLSLDDPISKYVEGVPNGEKITLRQLGNNTSGLFNSIENREFQQAIMDKPQRQWTAAEILKYAFSKPVYHKPGERWRYSNSNAILLGEVVEKVTGNSLAEEVQKRIAQPLTLKATGFPKKENGELPEPSPSAYRNGYANKVLGYGSTFSEVTQYSAAWTGAAGNMYSTLNDLGRAAEPLVTGTLLKAQGKRELHRWIDTGYQQIKYGFCIGNQDGVLGHTGDVPGYQAFLGYLPEPETSVIVLTNLSNNKDGTMPAEELAKMVIQSLRTTQQ